MARCAVVNYWNHACLGARAAFVSVPCVSEDSKCLARSPGSAQEAWKDVSESHQSQFSWWRPNMVDVGLHRGGVVPSLRRSIAEIWPCLGTNWACSATSVRLRDVNHLLSITKCLMLLLLPRMKAFKCFRERQRPSVFWGIVGRGNGTYLAHLPLRKRLAQIAK